jgi:hypothetical protein
MRAKIISKIVPKKTSVFFVRCLVILGSPKHLLDLKYNYANASKSFMFWYNLLLVHHVHNVNPILQFSTKQQKPMLLLVLFVHSIL